MTSQMDEAGRLAAPAEMAARFGLRPGAGVKFEEEAGSRRRRRRRPVTHLARLYIEPTARCNLNCRTCIRNVWDETPGDMTDATFSAVLDGLSAFAPPPTVFFGGFGEPPAHRRIVEMAAAVKALGCPVELTPAPTGRCGVTNGILLTEKTSRDLIEAGLDQLWVSLDGARPESYADVRLGAALPTVLANLGRFSDLRSPRRPRRPEIGIAFVTMRRNIADLPA